MRFVFSLLALRPGRVGGTEQHIRELLAALPAVLDGDEVIVLAGREAARAVDTPGLGREVLDLDDRALVARRGLEAFTPWRDRMVERALARLAPDAVFFPQISLYPKAVAAPTVAMVGDVQHLVLPRNFAPLDRAFRRAIYPYSLRRARTLLAISERTRADLVALARVDDAKIRVVRAGVPPPRDRAATPKPPVDGAYLYYPAVTNPHKGHDDLLRAFAALGDEHRALRLVLTGQRTSHWTGLEELARRLGVRERVLHLGYVDAAVVQSLYAHADAVVFPSRFEGFGLPVVEAASFGARVIASRLDVFDENGTVDVRRIDFGDPAQLGEALRLAPRAGLAPGAFTWRDAAAALMEALRDAARKR